MADTQLQERIAKLRARWDEGTANPDSMTAEAKKECLEELDEVCKSLGNMKEGLMKSSEEDERAENSATIKRSMARLVQINDELRKMGVLSNRVNTPRGSSYDQGRVFGRIPSNWMDKDEYLVRIEACMQEIKKLETELAPWQPAMPVMEPRARDGSGNVTVWAAVIPPPTDFLKGIFEKFSGARPSFGSFGHSGGQELQYTHEIQRQSNTLTQKIQQARNTFHDLLLNYKPISMKKIQTEMDKLNKEKEQLMYNLRVFECNGYEVDFKQINPSA